MKDDIDKLTLQIGVLTAAVTAIVKVAGAQNPVLALSVRSAMQQVHDAMLARGVSDESLELAQGTIDAILGPQNG